MPRQTKEYLKKEIESMGIHQSELKKANEDLYKKNESLRIEIKQLKVQNIDLESASDINLKEIDFGVGKLFYKIEPGSSMLLTDIMNRLNRMAMVTPLQDILSKLKY